MLYTRDEQRAFHRMAINLPVVIKKQEEVYKGICIDLSSTGMRVSFDKPGLNSGDDIDVFLNTDDERFLPLKAVAKLLRVTECDDKTFTAAVEFVVLK